MHDYQEAINLKAEFVALRCRNRGETNYVFGISPFCIVMDKQHILSVNCTTRYKDWTFSDGRQKLHTL